MRFQNGNSYGKLGGRPRGSRNALDAYAYAVALAHVQHNLRDPPPAEYADTNLWKALDITLRQNPRDYARQIISMLPKQVSFENVTARELADEELGRLIEAFRLREIELREERALDAVVEMKLIPNEAH